MKKKLLETVFEKAVSEGAAETRNGLSTHISKVLMNEFEFQITARTISNYHQKLEVNEPINISQDILDALSQYLGHSDFRTFIEANTAKTINKRRYHFVIIVLVLVIAYFIYDANQKKCMIWENDRYAKIHCKEANAKPIKSNLLYNFRKLEAQCRWDFFFNEDESPKVWYYKRGEKDLELFSSPGVHPIRGNDLKKINVDMIRKHICNSLE